ncbi:hypothetical protein [Neobacillus niacini]|uniref:hypothetical protein n=1 Tax=Neobacillus niacini TaxID=86668 RepID=UPI0021CB4744|nr:hypothetical protein [Neobacillus niacini]MCM3764935.1 hypothetical protein [Neobacillus niacini]
MPGTAPKDLVYHKERIYFWIVFSISIVSYVLFILSIIGLPIILQLGSSVWLSVDFVVFEKIDGEIPVILGVPYFISKNKRSFSAYLVKIFDYSG